jgi:hypothetical protein
VSAVAVADTASMPPRVVASVRELGRIEGLRLVKHPIFLAGFAFTILLAFAFPIGNEVGGDYFLLMGIGVLPIALATLVVANLAALRTRRSDTGELFASLSAPARVRTLAHLASLAHVVGFCVCVVAGGYVAFGAWDGIVVDLNGRTAMPSPFELANGPAAVAALGVLGLTLARWLPYLVVAPLAAVAMFVAQIPGLWNSQGDYAWFAPFVNTARNDLPGSSWPCSPEQRWPCLVDDFATTSAGWHLVYLAGIALVLAAVALWKEDRRPRIGAVAGLGLALVVAGGVLQVP